MVKISGHKPVAPPDFVDLSRPQPGVKRTFESFVRIAAGEPSSARKAYPRGLAARPTPSEIGANYTTEGNRRLHGEIPPRVAEAVERAAGGNPNVSGALGNLLADDPFLGRLKS